MTKILFICTGNTCRSPMAKVLFDKVIAESNNKLPAIKTESAGVRATSNQKVSGEAVKAVKRYGMNLSNHRARLLDEKLAYEADLLLTMTKWQADTVKEEYPEIAEKTFAISEYINSDANDITDPIGMGQDAYDSCAEQLFFYAQQILTRIRNELG